MSILPGVPFSIGDVDRCVNYQGFMVSVAQLVESRIVIPVVVGSSPIVHPIFCAIDTILGVWFNAAAFLSNSKTGR